MFTPLATRLSIEGGRAKSLVSAVIPVMQELANLHAHARQMVQTQLR
jgi:hypothetical protein